MHIFNLLSVHKLDNNCLLKILCVICYYSSFINLFDDYVIDDYVIDVMLIY